MKIIVKKNKIQKHVIRFSEAILSHNAPFSPFFLLLFKKKKNLKPKNPENIRIFLPSVATVSHSFTSISAIPVVGEKPVRESIFGASIVHAYPCLHLVSSFFHSFFSDLGVGCVVKAYSYSLLFS